MSSGLAIGPRLTLALACRLAVRCFLLEGGLAGSVKLTVHCHALPDQKYESVVAPAERHREMTEKRPEPRMMDSLFCGLSSVQGVAFALSQTFLIMIVLSSKSAIWGSGYPIGHHTEIASTLKNNFIYIGSHLFFYLFKIQ